MRPRLTLRYCAPARLTPAERESLWQLFRRGTRCSRPLFDRRLDANDELFLVQAGGRLVGFGGVSCRTVTYQGRDHRLIGTSQVFLRPEARGRLIVLRSGLRTWLRELAQHPLRPTYWFFGAGSVASYLVMARHFRACWPLPGVAWPEREWHLVRAMADDAPAGIEYDLDRGTMRGALAYVDRSRPTRAAAGGDPLVDWYHAANPGQADGESLVCLAPLSLSNWLSIFVVALPRALWRGIRAQIPFRRTPVEASR